MELRSVTDQAPFQMDALRPFMTMLKACIYLSTIALVSLIE